MATTGEHRPLHSLEYFGVSRKYWWSFDFLDLMRDRWRLDKVQKALDVGCGVGHWTAVLGTYLPPTATIVGVDREPEWIKLAGEAAKDASPPGRTRFQQGLVEALPFPDASFDLVTCQTLLIHLADPRAALREMHRVLQPGGLLALVEPNNVVQSLHATSVTAADSIDTILARVRFQLTCERGRAALGEGDFSIGDLLPGLVAELGFKKIQVHQSDKALPFFAPYDTEEQADMSPALFGDTFRPDSWMWSRSDSERYFAAGGGKAADFAAAWAGVEADNVRERDAHRAKTFHRAGGRTVYLVSGRK